MKLVWRILLAITLVLGMTTSPGNGKPCRGGCRVRLSVVAGLRFGTRLQRRADYQVGPWKNGNLVSVDETSTATVGCRPMGSVSLSAGDAVFDGGYLECYLDLAAVVPNNHKLTVEPVDNYGSILLRTRVKSTANTIAPCSRTRDARRRTRSTSPAPSQSRRNKSCGTTPACCRQPSPASPSTPGNRTPISTPAFGAARAMQASGLVHKCF